MQPDYHISDGKREIEAASTTDRLAQISKLAAPDEPDKQYEHNRLGRNLWTRFLDAILDFTRRHMYPLHAIGLVLTAFVLFVYARLVAATARLTTSGEAMWPDLPEPCVLALWHRDAPSLLVAFARRPTRTPALILVAGDPRGDCMALLCRMLGMQVVRTSGQHNGRTALNDLADSLKRGAHVIITADGGGPARVAKVGAVALASAANVPLVPLAADCRPAIQQRHKWDAARNPMPFSRLHVWLDTPQEFPFLVDAQSLEDARMWLQQTLNQGAARISSSIR